MSTQLRLRGSHEGGSVEVVFRLEKSSAADALLKLLPLSLTLRDYARTELIADLPRLLSTDGAPAAHSGKRGDLCYYAPWGNLALFYEDHGSPATGLVLLGRAEGRLDALNAAASSVDARLELVQATTCEHSSAGAMPNHSHP